MKPCLEGTRHLFDIVEAGLGVTIPKFVPNRNRTLVVGVRHCDPNHWAYYHYARVNNACLHRTLLIKPCMMGYTSTHDLVFIVACDVKGHHKYFLTPDRKPLLYMIKE
jgi:hypothetical protein